MKPLLSLQSVALKPKAPGLSMAVYRGQSAGILGPAGSGKTRLMRILAGDERPAEGTVQADPKKLFVAKGDFPRRATPNTIARDVAGQNSTRVTDALSALRLWDARNSPVADLSPSQQCACRVLSLIASPSPLLLIDGQFDGLDPWALDGAMRMVRGQLASGSALVASTHRADLVPFFDTLIVLQDGLFRFSGTMDDLLRETTHSEVEVETKSPSRAQAITSSFEVSVRKTDKGLIFSASEGQELAAKLLLEGYGDVRTVVLREPTAQEALLDLL